MMLRKSKSNPNKCLEHYPLDNRVRTALNISAELFKVVLSFGLTLSVLYPVIADLLFSPLPFSL